MISAIDVLFPTPQKCHDLIFTNSPGMYDFYRQSSTLKPCLGCRLVGAILARMVILTIRQLKYWSGRFNFD
jgi:hypothetical protein